MLRKLLKLRRAVKEIIRAILGFTVNVMFHLSLKTVLREASVSFFEYLFERPCGIRNGMRGPKMGANVKGTSQ